MKILMGGGQSVMRQIPECIFTYAPSSILRQSPPSASR
jgi:hypothetical protein